MAAVFGLGFLAYAPFGMYLGYRTRRGNIGEAHLRKLGMQTPLLAGFLMALGLTSVVFVDTRLITAGGAIAGAIAGLITVVFGYAYILLIELVGGIAIKAGWLSSEE